MDRGHRGQVFGDIEDSRTIERIERRRGFDGMAGALDEGRARGVRAAGVAAGSEQERAEPALRGEPVERVQVAAALCGGGGSGSGGALAPAAYEPRADARGGGSSGSGGAV